jgi:hypothetical protein
MPDKIPSPSAISLSIARKAVEVLNEALSLDPAAVNSLMNSKVRCNDALADHPTIVVNDQSGVTRVGLLGVINGIVARQTDEVIEACIDDGKVIGFRLRGEKS